ncbi:MAG: hypothetical protein K2P81_00145 [Bacteriovoracaceae bacterium]|nr:hypothetical protein [Bacteriovoracaceae bacterium]
MKLITLLVLCSFLGACSTSISKRDPASAKDHEEAVHQNFFGKFNH